MSLLAALVAIALVFALYPATALAAPGDTGTTDIWSWTVLADNTLAITGCTAPTGNLTLPDSLDFGALGTLSVTRIEDNAFFSYSDMTGISLPNSLKSIGKESFEGCSKLTDITIPDSVTAIDELAFIACSKLETVVMGNGVTTVGKEAFESCSSLDSITLSDKLESIPNMMFYYCSTLESITIPASVTTIGQSAFANSGLTGIVIPDTVTTLGQSIFQDCTSLATVTLPDSPGFTSLPFGLFFRCTGLKSITIPPHVTTIDDAAFYETGLTGIVLPDTVTSIGSAAFQGCQDLSSVTLPAGAGFTTIPENMFFRCMNLTGVTIPANVTTISEDAFGETGLTNITIPAGVTTIQIPAFESCPDLTGIQVNAANTHFSSQGGVLYDIDKSDLLAYPGGISGAFSIPQGVTKICEAAFVGCDKLTEVTIPVCVTNIGDYAFEDCSALTRVFILSQSMAFGEGILEGTAVGTDGAIYGHEGSTAQAYASSNEIQFIPLLKLTLSPASGSIFTGGRVTITPNIPGGTWGFEANLLSRNGNEFKGLAKGTAHVTYSIGVQSASADITISEAELPPTGQDFTPVLWLLVLAALACIAALLAVRRKNRSKT